MSDHTQDMFRTERDRTLDRILSAVQARIDAIPFSIVTNIQLTSPQAQRDAAEREAWKLLSRGIRHLKDGAPQGQPGSMAGALSKASLRSSAIAEGMGIKPPQFENVLLNVEYSNGHEAALFVCRRLIEAETVDLHKSLQLMQQKIYLERPPVRAEDMDGVSDPALRKIFDAVRESGGTDIRLPEAKEPTPDLAALRRQMVMTLNTLVDAYSDVCRELYKMLDAPLPAAAIKPRPDKSFDL